MPLSSSTVGKATKRFRHVADARWLMSYAAGLGDANERYFNTTGDIVAHPVFSVCPEWPVVLDARNVEGATTMTPQENRRGVHATHDVLVHRPIRADETLFTTATIISVEQRKPGAYQVMKLETVGGDGERLTTTYQGGLSRGVEVIDGDRSVEEVPTLPARPIGQNDGTKIEIPVPAGAAHIYTECAHIWNPIHTDRAFALSAGLPDVILHGTATLALAVSALVNHELDGDPTHVARYACRFAAMVLMPSTITLEIEAKADEHVWFTVWNENGELAIKNGYLGTQHIR